MGIRAMIRAPAAPPGGFAPNGEDRLEEGRFVLFDEATYDTFREALAAASS